LSTLDLAPPSVPDLRSGDAGPDSADFIAAVKPLLERHDLPRHPGVTLLAPGRPRRVHVISGSYGAGHDAAAREIALRLEAEGHHVERWDVVEMYPARLGRLARWLYLRQLDLVPRSWERLLARLQPGTRALWAACAFMGLAAPRVLELAQEGADLFVSTHPFASQVLGRLRASGRLVVPTVTYLVDASVHPLWVHESVDLHLGLHEGAVAATRALGGRADRVAPLVPAAYLPHRGISVNQRLAVRRALGLSATQRMVLVVGGSLGIGQLEQTASEIRDTGLAVPVVVCGTNAALHDRLVLVPGVVPLGWRDDLPALIQTADCVVGNAGGFTAWECLAAGTPVITSRSLPGHGTTNAAALAEAGLASWARTSGELRDALARVLGESQETDDLPAGLLVVPADA
jgi:processive 1,2-diacylglycerol beta-glucosyltransferase